jgi:membrane-associated protease RseP (regulator of RpoE activity)
MKTKSRIAEAAAFVLLALVASYVLVISTAVSFIVRAVMAIIVFAAAGMGIKRALSLTGSSGLYLLAGKRGLSFIDRISKHNRAFWSSMAMWGFVLGFGVLSYPLMRGKLSKKLFAFGMLSLVVIFVFVAPYLGYALQFINISMIQGSVSTTAPTHTSILTYVLGAVTALFGFSGFAILSMLYSAANIIGSIGSYTVGVLSGVQGASLSGQVPGVVPIIPGIDIPLVAGIISLVILLTVHELSHGILSRLSRVRLKSMGLLMFGILPIGAFVEPDDKMIKRLAPHQQISIFSAGVAANFVAMLVFFVLMMFIMLYVAPTTYKYGVFITATTPGYPAYNVISVGSQVFKWNGQNVSNISTLDSAASADLPGRPVTVVTSTGTYTLTAVQSPSNSTKGLIGVDLGYTPIVKGPVASAVYFLYTLFALSMLLNFLVAVFNLLPIPGLDGWSIYNASIKNKRLLRCITALVLLVIAINALPWIFYL